MPLLKLILKQQPIGILVKKQVWNSILLKKLRNQSGE